MTKIRDSYLYQEIHAQPERIFRLVEQNQSVYALRDAIGEQKIQHVVIVARGTSDNAGRYAKYLLGARNQMVVSLATPSLFTIYHQPPNLAGTLVIGISQSGQSPDINRVLEETRRQNALTAAICNDPRSQLAQTAEYVLDIKVGVEHSIAATKSYTGQLAMIALLSVALSNNGEALARMQQLPEAMEAALTTSAAAKDIAKKFQDVQHSAVIGRGYNYATAFEVALKLKELTYTIAEPYSSADFMHGPLALVEPGFPLIIIAPTGELKQEFLTFLQSTRDLGANLVAISDDADILAKVDCPLAFPASVPEWLSPLVTIIPGQLFSMHLAHIRGIDLDNPRAIRKVTKTV